MYFTIQCSMNLLIVLATTITFIPVGVYIIYILGSLLVKPNKIEAPETFPPISIVVKAYNEENAIGDRIKNLSDCYPKDKMEIIVSNDGSTDDTENVALTAFAECGIHGKVVTHKRGGANITVNEGIKASQNDIIIITDADGLFDNNTIKDLVSVLVSSEEIGAVTGDIVPISKGESIFSKSETAYRSIYGKICTWESNIHSTYCLNGAVVASKKSATSVLNVKKGADDASRGLSVIRNGYRCKYVPSAKFYEYITYRFEDQRRQKVRRATRLLEATLMNLDILSPKYGKFGTFIFPLRILMFFVVPAAFFLSITLWAAYFFSINLLYGFGFMGLVATAVLMGNFKSNMLSSFIIYQGYLFLGLLNVGRDVHIWEPSKRENS